MRGSRRSNTFRLIALASLTVLPACVGGLPYRRPGSDIVTRDGPSSAPWLARTVACSVRADSAKKGGASGSADDCARAIADTGVIRDPGRSPGHAVP